MSRPGVWTRRTFLQSGALAATCARALAAATRTPLAPAEFKKRLRGPILSAPTVYTADFKVDHAGMRTMVDRAARAGIGVFALTAGNNQYSVLTYDEIKDLTRVMV